MEQTWTILEFKIGGMSCAACSAAVERVTRRLTFVESATVNLSTERLRVRAVNPDSESIIHAVEKAGFTASPLLERKKQQELDRKEKEKAVLLRKKRLAVAAVFGAAVFILSMLKMFVRLPFLSSVTGSLIYTFAQILLLVPVLYCGRDFYIRGFRAAVKLHPNMDTLVAMGTVSSIVYSTVSLIKLAGGATDAVNRMYWDSAAVIVVLVMLGKHFEAGSKDKTLDSVRALQSLTPDKAEVLLENGESVSVDVENLMQGDRVSVKPGTRIPCDGTVIEGNGYVDESAMTGESLSVFKKAGDHLVAGTFNTNGFMVMEAKSVGSETTVAEMVALVEEAQGSKAPISRLADKIAAVFVPVVTGIALISALIWLLSGATFSTALNVFVSVLVVACPCSLGLATPTAIMVGTGVAAEKGILIKSGEILENAHKLTTVCFDKTGTLTVGKPSLQQVVSPSLPLNEFMALMASVEQKSEHPLAKAVLDYAAEMNISLYTPSDFSAIAGYGVEAIIDGHLILCGNPGLMEQFSITFDTDVLDTVSRKGMTPLLLAKDGEYLGLAAVSDTIRTDSSETVARLNKRHIQSVLVTGDHALTAQAIADKLGISQVYSGVLPKDKSTIIENLKKENRVVAMAGDGINDSIALATANIGFAVATGTDVAIAAADIVLLGNRLSSLADAIEISDLTMRVIRQNLFWAFFYNCIGISFAAGLLHVFGGPFLSPMICALAMSFSSVTVVSNALRLKYLCRKIGVDQ